MKDKNLPNDYNSLSLEVLTKEANRMIEALENPITSPGYTRVRLISSALVVEMLLYSRVSYGEVMKTEAWFIVLLRYHRVSCACY